MSTNINHHKISIYIKQINNINKLYNNLNSHKNNNNPNKSFIHINKLYKFKHKTNHIIFRIKSTKYRLYVRVKNVYL